MRKPSNACLLVSRSYWKIQVFSHVIWLLTFHLSKNINAHCRVSYFSFLKRGFWHTDFCRVQMVMHIFSVSLDWCQLFHSNANLFARYYLFSKYFIVRVWRAWSTHTLRSSSTSSWHSRNSLCHSKHMIVTRQHLHT